MSSSGVISIQGNIGAGKSTLLSFLNAEIIKEPVDLWQNVGGVNILERFYEDPKRWGMTFQLNALHSRTLLWKEFLNRKGNENGGNGTNGGKNRIAFSQRSPLADRYIFGEMTYKNGGFDASEYEVYSSICQTLIKNCPIQGIVYLRCAPEICVERIKIRNRKGQEDISSEYIEELHQRHEEWIGRQKNVPILIIDVGMYDIYNPEQQGEIKEKIEEFIEGLREEGVQAGSVKKQQQQQE